MASYTIQLDITGNSVNSYRTSTVDKTRHGSVIALAISSYCATTAGFSSYAGGVLVTNIFYCC